MISRLTKLVVTAAATLLIAPIVAEAADQPIPRYKAPLRSVMAYYNWTGFYVGVVGGYASGKADWDITAGGVTTTSSMSPKGWLFGGTIGYNFQAGSLVYGIEADYSFANVKGSTPDCFGAVGTTCEVSHSSLATVRGRIGYAFDRWLPYFTAGLAYAPIKTSISTAALTTDATKGRFGWTAGVGLEYALFGNWSVKAEYLHVDLGSEASGINFGAGVTDTLKFSEDIIRVGLNYRFSGPIFSRY